MTPITTRSAFLTAAAAAAFALLATAFYAAATNPVRIPQVGGNVDLCPEDSTRLKAEAGDLNAGFVSDGTVHIRFDDVYAAGPEPADRQSAFDWTLETAGFSVVYVIVMDGEDGANTYDYRPAGVTTDDFLTTPGPGQGEFTFKNISHVDFCHSEAPELQPLTATKTAVGFFGPVITWDLTKTVAPATHSGGIGDTFTSTWTVVVTKDEVPGDFVVEGEITIANPNHIDAEVEIEDVLDDATVATVTCPDTGDHTGAVPAGGELVCTHTAVVEDDTVDRNTAVVTSLTEGVEGTTAEAEVGWTETERGDQEVLLEDERFEFSETLIADETTTREFMFHEAFSCSAEGSFTHTNTATLTGEETDLTADASVTISCDDIQRPSIQVQQVRIASASNGGTAVTGSFVVKNMSGGDITQVTINQVSVSFVSRSPGGVARNHSGSCTFSPQANGYTLQPHEARQFSFRCTISPAVPSDATELTARVTVGTATNRLGEVRGPFSDNSTSFRLRSG